MREQKDAVGHSVRAVYLYTAMADIAHTHNDAELLSACNNLWNSITQKRMYITGAIGSTVHGEAFTVDYDLPSDTAYAETCASIGLMMFASQMLRGEVKAEFLHFQVLYLSQEVRLFTALKEQTTKTTSCHLGSEKMER